MRYNFYVNTTNFFLGILMGIAFFGTDAGFQVMCIVTVAATPFIIIACRDKMRQTREMYQPMALRHAGYSRCVKTEEKKAA